MAENWCKKVLLLRRLLSCARLIASSDEGGYCAVDFTSDAQTTTTIDVRSSIFQHAMRNFNLRYAYVKWAFRFSNTISFVNASTELWTQKRAQWCHFNILSFLLFTSNNWDLWMKRSTWAEENPESKFRRLCFAFETLEVMISLNIPPKMLHRRELKTVDSSFSTECWIKNIELLRLTNR